MTMATNRKKQAQPQATDKEAQVTVKALSPVSAGGEYHKAGESFSAPERAVRDALAVGLVKQATE